MLKINIFVPSLSPDDFNFKNLLQEVKEDGWRSYIMEGTYPLSVNINGIEILDKMSCFPFNENLKALNNLFYRVITVSEETEVKINFMAGLGAPENYLHAIKKKNRLCLFGKKGDGFQVNFSEFVDLGQAVEEVICVVKEYGKICAQVAKTISSEDSKVFLVSIFVEPTWNHDSWFPLERVWEEYKKINKN